jgi:hypothetical protein
MLAFGFQVPGRLDWVERFLRRNSLPVIVGELAEQEAENRFVRESGEAAGPQWRRLQASRDARIWKRTDNLARSPRQNRGAVGPLLRPGELGDGGCHAPRRGLPGGRNAVCLVRQKLPRPGTYAGASPKGVLGIHWEGQALLTRLRSYRSASPPCWCGRPPSACHSVPSAPNIPRSFIRRSCGVCPSRWVAQGGRIGKWAAQGTATRMKRDVSPGRMGMLIWPGLVRSL